MSEYYVYILANKRNGTLYTGLTSDLVRRVHEHKNNLIEGFTKRYNIHHLVYYEACETHEAAFILERRIKGWKRRWKLELIEKMNPEWEDLYEKILPR